MSYAEPGIRVGRPAWRLQIVMGVALTALFAVAGAAELSDIVAEPIAGQSADQQRRDRYECHNWVIAQTGMVPAPGQASEAGGDERRADRVGNVIAGAAVGAAAGSVIRGASKHRDAGDGALAGGVLGAIAGAFIGKRRERADADDSFSEYFRALDACMTGRGYELRITDAEA